ncbi:MAG: ComF family protein [Blastocatellia bacterium]
MRLISDVKDGLAALAYPAQCRVCGAMIERYDDGVACNACWADVEITPLFDGALCGKCGHPLAGLAISERAALRCGMCEGQAFTTARACGAYAGALEASILFLKSYPHLCRRLRRLIAQTFAAHQAGLAAEVIVPVPLHPKRQRERGFNQAEMVARVIARYSRLPLVIHMLSRSKPTERHRAGLDARDRARSVADAFRVSDPRAVINASILLVDDLFTTGGTLSAAARTLMDTGARQVSVLTIARVVTAAAARRRH